MSLPRYPKYKDCGVEWLGELPSEWSTQRIRFLFEIRKRIAGAEGYDVLSITQQGIKIKDIESNDGQLSMDYSKYQFVEIGDFAMNHMDLLTGYVDISKYFGVTSPDYRVFALKDAKACHDRYFLHVFQNAYRQKIFYPFGQGSSQLGRWRLPTEQFNDFVLPFPSLREQAAIASFIDQEIAKIDALVEEQRRLIELLKEKRQAVISHAVTKGLNPNAPMKPSGIDWLGDVPCHWKVFRLGRAATLQGGVAFSSEGFGLEGIPIVRMNNLRRGPLDLTDAVRIPAESCNPSVALSAGDLVWGMSGSVGDTGSLGNYARVTAHDLPCQLNQRVGRFVTRDSHLGPDFLEYVIQTSYFYEQIMLLVTGTAQFNVSSEQVESCLIALPPFAEQQQIVFKLRQRLSDLDSLKMEATRAIDLLQERRSALISAAVTGKIDVRGLAGTEAA